MRLAHKTVWILKNRMDFFTTVVQFTQVLFRVACPSLKKETLKKKEWSQGGGQWTFLLRKKRRARACISKGREGRLKRRKKYVSTKWQRMDCGINNSIHGASAMQNDMRFSRWNDCLAKQWLVKWKYQGVNELSARGDSQDEMCGEFHRRDARGK